MRAVGILLAHIKDALYGIEGPISHLENKREKSFQWGSGGWEAEAWTLSKALLRYLWGLYSIVRLICMICVVIQARRERGHELYNEPRRSTHTEVPD